MRLYLVTVVFLGITSPSKNYGTVWRYDDQHNWPGDRCREGGKRQSPIDIKTTDVIKDFNSLFIKYGNLKFVGYKKVLLSAINNGLTIQFTTDGDETIHPTITGGPLKHNYRLEQMHFHWISEHSLNGIKFPMEIHFVHVQSDLSVDEALMKRDGLAIIAVFCEVQADLDDYENTPVDEIIEHLPNLTSTGDRMSGILLDISKLLSPKNNNYFTYAGSLTSPECNEVVIWIIYQYPIRISDTQYRQFSKISAGRHNFRSQQRLSQHVVFTPPSNHVNKPHLVMFFENVVNLVADFFRNVTTYMKKELRSR
uniref:Carbonic anhydrase n=1 Tax=Bombyx mori TaxID=7091 RepID=A0A8R2LV15_BOMMO|nr:carbonic anhydrase 1 [Bombyx mori]